MNEREILKRTREMIAEQAGGDPDKWWYTNRSDFERIADERMIRPAVILRKVSQSNRSEKGAAVQAVLMSIYRTLKLCNHYPLADSVKYYV